jgi:hypothetical protein
MPRTVGEERRFEPPSMLAPGASREKEAEQIS